jgi:hypothetical protein
MEPTLMITAPEGFALPLPPGLARTDGEEIQGLEVTYHLDPVRRDGDRVVTSLLAEIRYHLAAGATWAREWVRVPVEVRRCAGGWRCQMGPGWCWSTDWPD